MIVASSVSSQSQDTLSVISLVTWQLNFLDELCSNRTENSKVFDELKETIKECEKSLLLNTQISELSYNSLVNSDVKLFRDFYNS